MSRAEVTDFGKKVVMRLIEKGMTQTELAERLGCTKQYLYKILSGQRSGKKYVETLCTELNLDLDETPQ